jgi:hypothetical protein
MPATYTWLENLEKLNSSELENLMPDEKSSEERSANHRYIPKFIPVGIHDVVIEEAEMMINEKSQKPYFQLVYKDANGSTMKHNQYVYSNAGDKFNIFFELFIRSLGDLTKLQKAQLSLILLKNNAILLKGLKLNITVGYKNEGYTVEKDESTSEYFLYDRKAKQPLFDGKGFKDYKEAKAFVDNHNIESETPLKQSYTEVKKFERAKEPEITQDGTLQTILNFYSTPASAEVPKVVPRRVVK